MTLHSGNRNLFFHGALNNRLSNFLYIFTKGGVWRGETLGELRSEFLQMFAEKLRNKPLLFQENVFL